MPVIQLQDDHRLTPKNNPTVHTVFQPFQDLAEPVRASIDDMSSVRTYRAEETVISAGGYSGDSFYVVISGTLSLALANRGTGEIQFEQVEPGETLGLELVLAHGTGSNDDILLDLAESMVVNAQTECRVQVIDGEPFRELIGNRPSLSKSLLHYLAHRNIRRQSRQQGVQVSPIITVAEYLASNLERDTASGAWLIRQLPKHRELADRTGLDESDVADVIAMLIQQGIVQRQYPGLQILDLDRFEKLYQ